MIKKIHYIWLGGRKKPHIVKKCISSWRKMFPDWEILEWNESNVNFDINVYCRQAYDLKKYAFVSDVLRFDVLYRYGGIYFDTDVQVLKPFYELIEKYNAFSGFENEYVSPGLVTYAEPNNHIVKEMLDSYNNRSFLLSDGSLNVKTVGQYFTEILKDYGLVSNNELQTVDGFTIFPKTFFCPTDAVWSIQDFTNNTYTIHHFAASWAKSSDRNKLLVRKILYKTVGIPLIQKLKKLRSMLKFI